MTKFWLKFAGLMLVHTLLLPLKILVSWGIRGLWFPGIKTSAPRPAALGFQDIDLRKKAEKARASLDVSAILKDGDGAKFLGLAYASCKDLVIWKSICELFRNPYTFTRTPQTPGAGYNEHAFSGDMWAGMFPAIVTAHQEGHISECDKALVLRAKIYDTVFLNKPFTFRQLGGGPQDRGFLLPWYGLGPAFYDALSICHVGELLGGELVGRYRILKRILWVLGWPLMGSLRQGVFVGNVYLANFFTEHSSLVKAYYLYKLTGSRRMRNAVLRQVADHPWFMDGAKIEADIRGTVEARERHLAFLHDYGSIKVAPKGLPAGWAKTFFAVKGLETKRNYAGCMLPYRFRRGAKYLDDSKPMKPKMYDRKGWTADFIHAYNWED